MCYSAEAATRRLIEYALHRGDIEYAKVLEGYLEQILRDKPARYFVSGFANPELLVFTNEEPMKPQLFTWGLIPVWAKDLDSAKKARRNTLNARCESMFELNSFKNSALKKRCLIYLDAFYEYHSANKKKYPFRIASKAGEPLAMAGLWSEWTDKTTGEIFRTCAIVTTEANQMMSKIHNEPAVSETPRMPVILPREKQNEWLTEIKSEDDKKHILSLCRPYDDNLMEAHTVGQLIGKTGIGNLPEARQYHKYEELVF
jgi:putative SOS response-associated peptidase YedK